MPEITDDEMALFESYKELGKIEDITSALEEGETNRRSQIEAEVASTMGWKPSVLKKLASGIELFMKKDKPFVKDGDKETPLEEYADENWEDFLPSLKAAGEKQTVPFVRQPTKEKEAEKNQGAKLVNAHIQRTYGAPEKAA